MEIENIYKILNLVGIFSSIERNTPIATISRMENDTEHSYTVAIVAWYLSDKLKMKVNRQLLFEYALAHDLEEIYTGDYDAFNSTDEKLSQKRSSEIVASERLLSEFSDFDSLHQTLERYKTLTDVESQIVYIIDKTLPVLCTHSAKHDYYHKANVTKEQWLEWFNSKIKHTTLMETPFIKYIDSVKIFVLSSNGLFPETK